MFYKMPGKLLFSALKTVGYLPVWPIHPPLWLPHAAKRPDDCDSEADKSEMHIQAHIISTFILSVSPKRSTARPWLIATSSNPLPPTKATGSPMGTSVKVDRRGPMFSPLTSTSKTQVRIRGARNCSSRTLVTSVPNRSTCST